MYGDTGFNRELNKRGLKRLFLHAAKIEIPGADGEKSMVIEAPLDDDLVSLLVKLRRTS